MTCGSTLQATITLFSVMILTALLGKSFQQWLFLLFWLPCQDTVVMAAGPHYIASAQTAQKTPLPTVLLLLCDIAIGTDCVENTTSHSYSSVACYTAIT
jgi:hypothetical protein